MIEYLCAGAVVMALSGREKNQIFLVYSNEGEKVLIVNGTTRTIEDPKKKNKKHLHLLCKSEVSGLNMSEISNAQIKNFLSNYNKSRGK